MEIPAKHTISPERANQWVITCADDNVYSDLLIPFIGSLISVAKWEGQIVVFDYGLSPEHARVLDDFGVHVEPVPKKTFVNLDRFLHLAPYAEKNEGIISQWDADCWFTDSVSSLFDEYTNNHGHRLICNLDRVFQQSCYWVAREDPEIIQKVHRILEPIKKEHGNVLQCGWIMGASPTLARFCRYLQGLIESVEYHPEWNSDTVGLNYWYYHNRDDVGLVDQTYNCLPDWRPERRGNHFFLEDRQMRVMHVTSPWRRVTDGDQFRFQAIYPELYKAWREQLQG